MIRRSSRLAFAAGQTVFPGGRVDPADLEMAQDLPGDSAWNAARLCAMREALEETGLLIGVKERVAASDVLELRKALCAGGNFWEMLGKANLALDIDALVPFARWLPPRGIARRFDTRFVLADVGTGSISLEADGSEATDIVWSSARATLASWKRRELGLMFPTHANLLQLSRYASFAEARRERLSAEIGTIRGVIEDRDGEPWLTISGEHGFPDVAMPARLFPRT